MSEENEKKQPVKEHRQGSYNGHRERRYRTDKPNTAQNGKQRHETTHEHREYHERKNNDPQDKNQNRNKPNGQRKNEMKREGKTENRNEAVRKPKPTIKNEIGEENNKLAEINKEVEAKKEEAPVRKEVKKEVKPEISGHTVRYAYIAFVCFKESKKIYTFGTNDETLKVNDHVVVETIRGLEVGQIVKESRAFCEVPTELEIKPIVRKATEKDLRDIESNALAAKDALKVCEAAINKLNLEMRLIDAEYTLDRSKIIFVYVADDRVDFRDLLKELATQFKCRIELRQIGPRNKAKIIGGLGMCGMETCCSRFLNDFDVVSINMAKNQLLALNVQKLSGQCGKLMCCLKYEDSQYKQMREGLPKLNSQIEYKGSRYRITSLNVLLKQVKIENKEDVQFLDFSELWPDIDWSKR